MNGFNEKCDAVLRYLKDHDKVSWSKFTQETQMLKVDAILIYLKEKMGFIDYADFWVNITDKGKQFITTTSFVEQRKSSY